MTDFELPWAEVYMPVFRPKHGRRLMLLSDALAQIRSRLMISVTRRNGQIAELPDLDKEREVRSALRDALAEERMTAWHLNESGKLSKISGLEAASDDAWRREEAGYFCDEWRVASSAERVAVVLQRAQFIRFLADELAARTSAASVVVDKRAPRMHALVSLLERVGADPSRPRTKDVAHQIEDLWKALNLNEPMPARFAHSLATLLRRDAWPDKYAGVFSDENSNS